MQMEGTAFNAVFVELNQADHALLLLQMHKLYQIRRAASPDAIK